MDTDEMRISACCFFGHRKTEETKPLRNNLYNTIEDLIVNKNVSIFLFGSKSAFDDLCHEVVTELKVKYPFIKRIYVRAEYPYINDDYNNYLLESCEETYYPEKIKGAGKASYVERNREMIDKSEFCVVYYDEKYTPPKRKSGTKIAYDYAVKKGLNIINLFSYL